MTEKSMVSAKVAERTKERLDEYADREGISRSQVIDRMLKQGLDVEQGNVKTVPIVEEDDSEEMTVAHSPFNETDWYTVTTLALVFLVTIKVYGIA